MESSTESALWSLLRRPPQVIDPVDQPAVERQWAIWSQMSGSARLNLGLRMSEHALQQRRQRLQRRFPEADAKGIAWAVIREILDLEPGTTPVPR